jgi:arylsulfatase
VFLSALAGVTAPVWAQDQKKPNIVVIMGDDVGWFNISAYHRGIMSGKTPNLDALASQGMLFTDYYAEASCTAGRASFITGEIPLRTGLTTVGQAGADVVCRTKRQPLPLHLRRRATPLANSAKTISVI